MHEAQRNPNRLNIERSLLRHVIFMLAKVNDRNNFESRKRKMVCHMQSYPHETISIFLSRNLAGQERVQCYIQSTKVITTTK